MMPPFTSINNVDVNDSNKAVEELDMCKTNSKEFKNAVKYTIATLTILKE